MFLPMLTRVYICLPLYSHAYLAMFTPVYSCLPIFTRVYLFTPDYLYLPLLTGACLPI